MSEVRIPGVDLHVHTTASDGTLTPKQVVALAKESGLAAIAITDHDTVAGLREALEAGDDQQLHVIPGVEISVNHGKNQLHLLGYYIDPHNDILLDCLEHLQMYRRERNPEIVEKLRDLGFEVSLEEVTALAGGEIVGRPHFASLLVNKGYVADKQQAFNLYLANGQPAYVPKERLTPAEGINIIKAAGGVAVLAHPGQLEELKDKTLLQQLINKLKQEGLQGIEAYYTEHAPETTELLLQIARAENLLVTGGSDFHGDNKPHISIGTGLGNLHIPFQVVENLAKAVVLTS